ncbi:MAG: DinB family protein [Sphingobacteriales bacterium]|nr:MAG: DinB family protein [Sphingobacteriales bacterium]
MENILKAWKTSRQLHGSFFDRFSLEQLNKIPAGFNNNIIWNLGHIIVAQQSLIYKSSNLPMHIDDDLFERYKPGSRPIARVSAEEAQELKTLLTSLIGQVEDDLAAKKFVHFNERTTITGFHLGNLTDAFEFNNYHEGIHLGYIMSIKNFL